MISIEIGMPVDPQHVKMMGKEAIQGKEIMKIIGNSSVSVEKMGNMVANESAPAEHNRVIIPMIKVVGNKQEIISIIESISQ